MKYYKVELYWKPSLKNIQEIEIEKETAKCVYIHGYRSFKHTEDTHYVKDYNDAINLVKERLHQLISQKTAKIKTLEDEIIQHQTKLKELNDII